MHDSSSSSSIGQFIFFAIVVVISIISRLFAQKKENDNSAPPPKIDWNEKPAPPRQRPQYQPPKMAVSEDERVRQFMDALGLPANTPPPIRRAAAPLTTNAPAQPPKMVVSQSAQFPASPRPDFSASQRARQQYQTEQKRRIDAAQQLLQKTQPSQPAQPENRAAAEFAEEPEQMTVSGSAQIVQRLVERSGKQIVAQPTSPLANAGFEARKLMRSRSGLRTAFLMQQIFGAPKSLQPLQP